MTEEKDCEPQQDDAILIEDYTHQEFNKVIKILGGALNIVYIGAKENV